MKCDKKEWSGINKKFAELSKQVDELNGELSKVNCNDFEDCAQCTAKELCDKWVQANIEKLNTYVKMKNMRK